MFKILKKDLPILLLKTSIIFVIMVLYGTVMWGIIKQYNISAMFLVSSCFSVIVLTGVVVMEQGEQKQNGIQFLLILPITFKEIINAKFLNLLMVALLYYGFSRFSLWKLQISGNALEFFNVHLFLMFALSMAMAIISFRLIYAKGNRKALFVGIQLSGIIIMYIQMIAYFALRQEQFGIFIKDLLITLNTPLLYIISLLFISIIYLIAMQNLQRQGE